jgi:hypothetical protein
MRSKQQNIKATKQLIKGFFSPFSYFKTKSKTLQRFISSRFKIVILFLFSIFILSFSKDMVSGYKSASQQILEMRMVDDYVETILGAQRSNPYTVSHMRNAFSSLYGTIPTNINATHYYIRLDPQDADMLKKLDTMDINTYHYPLDHEVIEMGDYYLHSDKQIGDIPILYAVVKVDRDISDLPYTILDTVHLGSEDEALIRKAIELKGYDPDEEGYVVVRPPAGWSPDPIQPEEPNSGPLVADRNCNCKNGLDPRNPAGCISVFDTQLSTSNNCTTYKGVSHVKVILKDTWVRA